MIKIDFITKVKLYINEFIRLIYKYIYFSRYEISVINNNNIIKPLLLNIIINILPFDYLLYFIEHDEKYFLIKKIKNNNITYYANHKDNKESIKKVFDNNVINNIDNKIKLILKDDKEIYKKSFKNMNKLNIIKNSVIESSLYSLLKFIPDNFNYEDNDSNNYKIKLDDKEFIINLSNINDTLNKFLYNIKTIKNIKLKRNINDDKYELINDEELLKVNKEINIKKIDNCLINEIELILHKKIDIIELDFSDNINIILEKNSIKKILGK